MLLHFHTASNGNLGGGWVKATHKRSVSMLWPNISCVVAMPLQNSHPRKVDQYVFSHMGGLIMYTWKLFILHVIILIGTSVSEP